MLFGQKRIYPKNNSGRECGWPYLIGQHPLSPVFGQKRPGTPGNSYFAQLPPVFGHFMFRFWSSYVSFRWATRLLEPINIGHKNRTGVIFGTTVRHKRHGAEDSSGQEYRMDGWLHEVVGGLRPTWSL